MQMQPEQAQTAMSAVDQSILNPSEAEPVEAQLIGPAEELFERGADIAERFERSVGTVYDVFLQEAIPYAREVARARPWEADVYHLFAHSDEKEALRSFLEAAFSSRAAPKTASQQSKVVAMLVSDGLEYTDIAGIYFRNLLKLSYHVQQIPQSKRLELLGKARTEKVTQFEATVDSAARGTRKEPRTQRTISAPESAISKLDDFDAATATNGDTRPLGDKLVDVAAQHTQKLEAEAPQQSLFPSVEWIITDPERQQLYQIAYSYLLRKEPSYEGLTFWEIVDRQYAAMLEVAECDPDGGLTAEESQAFHDLLASRV